MSNVTKTKRFAVAVSWEVSAYQIVEALDQEDAIRKVEECDGLPSDSEYVDSSFTINEECIYEV